MHSRHIHRRLIIRIIITCSIHHRCPFHSHARTGHGWHLRKIRLVRRHSISRRGVSVDWYLRLIVRMATRTIPTKRPHFTTALENVSRPSHGRTTIHTCSICAHRWGICRIADLLWNTNHTGWSSTMHLLLLLLLRRHSFHHDTLGFYSCSPLHLLGKFGVGFFLLTCLFTIIPFTITTSLFLLFSSQLLCCQTSFLFALGCCFLRLGGSHCSRIWLLLLLCFRFLRIRIDKPFLFWYCFSIASSVGLR
mmetsp:Transcript_10237/g.14474  ORF Transcript_10237/g.14474 Transcript_10237/m.14474 type:complete len:249 (-) Transcript_10237:2143-2889(-)